MTVFGGVFDTGTIRAVLGGYRWADRSPDLALELEFLDGKHGAPQIDDWLVALPQLKNPSKRSWVLDDVELSAHRRSYWQDTPPLLNAYAGADDRAVAEVVTGKRTATQLSADLAELAAPRRAVMLVYPITHDNLATKHWTPTIGFSLLFPSNSVPQLIGFTVKKKAQSDVPIVDAT